MSVGNVSAIVPCDCRLFRDPPLFTEEVAWPAGISLTGSNGHKDFAKYLLQYFKVSLIIIETVHIVDIVCNLDVVDIVDICEPVDIVDFMAG